MKDLAARCSLIFSAPGERRQWIERYKNLDWKVMPATGLAMIRRQWPCGFLRAAKIGALVIAGCALVRSSEPIKHEKKTAVTPSVYKEIGEASWYGPGFHGEETASGEIFNTHKMTAAHPSLPLGTRVEVTNLEKNKSVEVRINDRGPYVDGRVIDLSRAAAKELGMVKDGTTKVKIVSKTVKKKKKSSSKKKSSKKKTSKKSK